MNWLLRYIIGYLTIEISAENGEMLLNKAVNNKIKIWNLYCKNRKIKGDISIKDFLKLRHIVRGIKCKIKIINKNGLCFRTKKYNKRFGLLIGAALFLMLLATLSNFVWVINVEGNDRILKCDIINDCASMGIREGVLKSKVNSKYDAQRLQLLNNDIAWCSLNIEGSVLTINLSETAVSSEKDRKNPTNLKALISGKIKKINISSGDAVVKVGDYVSKGDLLVSGVCKNMHSTLFLYSSGEIIAETKREFSAEGEYTQTISNTTGDSLKRYTLSFFNLKIPLYLGNVTDKSNYTHKIKNLELFNKKIPIKIATEKYEFLNDTTVFFDKEKLKNKLYEDIKKQVASIDLISAVEGEKEIIYTERGMLLKINYLCEENIAIQDTILFNTQN